MSRCKTISFYVSIHAFILSVLHLVYDTMSFKIIIIIMGYIDRCMSLSVRTEKKCYNKNISSDGTSYQGR